MKTNYVNQATPFLGGDLKALEADKYDRYDLIRAIRVCDALIEEVRRIQLNHAEALCRVANHLAFAVSELDGCGCTADGRHIENDGGPCEACGETYREKEAERL
jgi:hypothetical protein